MFTPRSFLLTTKLAIDARLGELRDCGRYVLVRHPDNPTFYEGNYLLYPSAPAEGDGARWLADWADAFGDDPEVRHITFEWDAPDGDLGACGELVRAGFELMCFFGMSADADRFAPAPDAPPEGITIRPLDATLDADWRALLDSQRRAFARDDGEWSPRDEAFLQRRVEEFRALCGGDATWWGAFADTTDGPLLVGSLGVARVAGYGRYQEVVTDPDWRRRGICDALLRVAGHDALSYSGIDALAIEGMTDNHPALDAYRKVGFQVTEYGAALCKTPTPEEGAAP